MVCAEPVVEAGREGEVRSCRWCSRAGSRQRHVPRCCPRRGPDALRTMLRRRTPPPPSTPAGHRWGRPRWRGTSASTRPCSAIRCAAASLASSVLTAWSAAMDCSSRFTPRRSHRAGRCSARRRREVGSAVERWNSTSRWRPGHSQVQYTCNTLRRMPEHADWRHRGAYIAKHSLTPAMADRRRYREWVPDED